MPLMRWRRSLAQQQQRAAAAAAAAAAAVRRTQCTVHSAQYASAAAACACALWPAPVPVRMRDGCVAVAVWHSYLIYKAICCSVWALVCVSCLLPVAVAWVLGLGLWGQKIKPSTTRDQGTSEQKPQPPSFLTNFCLHISPELFRRVFFPLGKLLLLNLGHLAFPPFESNTAQHTASLLVEFEQSETSRVHP